MENVSTYKYALGTIEKLAKGDLTTMLTGTELNDFLIGGGESPMILSPEVIGVYQIRSLSAEEEGLCEECLEEINKEYQRDAKLADEEIKEALEEVWGERDNYDADLIALVYGIIPGLNKPLIEELMNDSLKRINIMSNFEAPDFTKKKGDEYIIDTLNHLNEVIDPREYLKEEGTNLANKLKQEQSKYGLTRSEYLFLKSMDFIGRKENQDQAKEVVNQLSYFFTSNN